MDNQDPPIQVHWYNEHTAFLRQNKAYSYEAPFLHLYFGNERILLLDQGFTQLRTDWALRDVVDECIERWCKRHGRRPEDMEFLLAFSHLHSDHYAALNQFADRPNTRYMGLTHEEMVGFWGMTNYPEERVTLGEDLVEGPVSHVAAEGQEDNQLRDGEPAAQREAHAQELPGARIGPGDDGRRTHRRTDETSGPGS